MIKIELEFPTGAEARLHLAALLGVIPSDNTKSENRIGDKKIAENFSEPKTEIENAEKPAEENVVPIKKRRTKAEIAADEAGNKVAEPTEEAAEPETSDIQGNTAEPASEGTITLQDLQKKFVELGRIGKKELCRAVLKKFDAESLSSTNPLKREYYAEVLQKVNEL